MTRNENLNDYKEAYHTDFKFNDENMAMLVHYAKQLIAYATRQPRVSIVGLGIGHRIVSQTIYQALNNVDKFTIVEGSPDIIAEYKSQTKLPAYADIVHGYFEEFEPGQQYDIVEMGFVLEHVDDPDVIVSRFKRFLKPGGRMFMAVPNALSLHRRIGYEAGLLKDPYALSNEDLMLGHKRYFDYNSFTKLALRNGLKIVAAKGIMLKPVTTGQMQQLKFSDAVYEGMFKVAEAYPELANSMLLEVTV